MKIKNEQRFYSAIKDVFIGEPIQGKSGYVNLMNIKQQYFSKIEPYIKKQVDELISDESAREELFEKLYTFFDSYFNETGTVFFANTQIHKNLYEHVYSDRDDVSLFWKTQKLYYVKSEANYQDLDTKIDNFTFKFDASDIEHQKSNEKKELEFYLVNISDDKNTFFFKVLYKKQASYDRLKVYLNISDTAKLKNYLKENFPNISHPHINVKYNCFSITDFSKAEILDNIQINNIEDALKSVKIELAICKIKNLLKYFQKKSISIDESQINKAFQIYKKQNEVDYFIHKDAAGFLKEQFNIYLYNYLFNEQDLQTVFDQNRVKQIQNIKTVTYNIIEYIAKFEDELKAIWNKPKFVRKSNYVISIDKITDKSILNKIIKHPNYDQQKKEWAELGINYKSKYLPIDTKYFKDIEFDILNIFEQIDNSLNGILIKSENYQALNTILPKFRGLIKTIYIDPPFNLGTNPDYDYKVNYKDSTWLTILENRIQIAKDFLNKSGNFFLRCDYNGNFISRLLLEDIFSDNFINELIVSRIKKSDSRANKYNTATDTVYWFSKTIDYYFDIQRFINPRDERWHAMDSQGQGGALYILGNLMEPPRGRHWTFGQDTIYGMEREGKIRLNNKGKPQYFIEASETQLYDSNWTDISGYSSITGFQTENAEVLLERIIKTGSKENDWIFDFFMGSATTQSTAQKLNRKWVGVEQGGQFYSYDVPRLKKVLGGIKNGISDNVEYSGGGFFKYYELEQYEETLSIAKYNPKEDDLANINFEKDEKLLDAIEIDYEKENVKIIFEKLYPDVDIAETISNLTGWKIKKLFKDKAILDNDGRDVEIIYNEMTFNKYPFIKPLIWWKSKK